MRSAALALTLMLMTSGTRAAQPEGAILAPGAKLQMESTTGAGEGPAWHPEIGLLCSGEGNINRYDRSGRMHVYREGAGTNGLLFDGQGGLLCCQSQLRRFSRIDPAGKLTVLTERYQGQRYNQPNDLTVDSQGRIYFSDPRYGDRNSMEMVDDEGRKVEGVYRIDPDGHVERVITHEVDRPNGVLVTSDDRYLYVADNNNNMRGGARKLYRFALKADGRVDVASQKQIFDWKTGRGPDGMAEDRDGRLFVAGGRNRPSPPFETADEFKGGVYVFSPEGELVEFIPVLVDEVTNCTFGGPDLKTLFITGGGALWSIRVNTPGVTRH